MKGMRKVMEQKIERYIWEQQINKLAVVVIGNDVEKIG